MEEDTRKLLYYAVPIAVVIALGVALYYGRKSKEPEAEPAAQAQPAPVIVPPAIQNPIDTQGAGVKPLPALDESDADAKESLTGLFGGPFEEFLVPQGIVRNVVVTIDNLPRKKVAVQRWPLKPTAGALVTSGGDSPTLSPENYARYAPLIALVRNSDAHEVAALYRRYYPLLQKAYVELGYPDGYFNDRLIEVIDHLLETPDVRGPIQLVQPSVAYQFADPALEERSAGQKLLIRMGPDNAAAVKAKLRQLRAEVAKPRA